MSEVPTARGTGSPSVHPILVLKVPKSVPVWVRFLGPLRQLGTHKQGNTPLVCWGTEKCDPKRHRLQYRSKWYAAAQVWINEAEVWRAVVVEVTEALERKLRGDPLRGQVWCLYRKPKEKLSKEIHGERQETLPEGRLPPKFEVDPILCRLFGEMDLPEPQPNLLEERPMAEDEAGERPRALARAAEPPKKPLPASPSKKDAELSNRLVGKLGDMFRSSNGVHANGTGEER